MGKAYWAREQERLERPLNWWVAGPGVASNATPAFRRGKRARSRPTMGRIDGEQHPGSDHRGAAPATEAGIHGDKVTEYVYLDRGTSSLRSTAYTSLDYTWTSKEIR